MILQNNDKLENDLMYFKLITIEEFFKLKLPNQTDIKILNEYIENNYLFKILDCREYNNLVDATALGKQLAYYYRRGYKKYKFIFNSIDNDLFVVLYKQPK